MRGWCPDCAICITSHRRALPRPQLQRHQNFGQDCEASAAIKKEAEVLSIAQSVEDELHILTRIQGFGGLCAGSLTFSKSMPIWSAYSQHCELRLLGRSACEAREEY